MYMFWKPGTQQAFVSRLHAQFCVPVTGWQALSLRHVESAVQPQAPVETLQVGPGLHEVVQSRHVAPPMPHAPSTPPPAHWPFDPQQPPLQSWLAVHALVHFFIVVSQASPAVLVDGLAAGQSEVWLQPQA